ncbi:MAG: DUF2330 domain-containing protein [Actinomycetota bacterium]|nr:DUF2330 domain-containing protein [Actinomycetota bacterium]
MGKRILVVAVTVLAALLLSAVPARADGGLFGKGGRDISEPQQKAVIFFHEGTEELVLSVRYEGVSEDFAWLVPTPEPPRIEEGSISLFEVMSGVTQAPAGHGRNKNQDIEHLGGEGWVEVLDEMTVGAFDLTVLRAGDAGELRAWLEERGFAYDGEAEALLADYIERAWCFTAMRISPAYEDTTYGSVEYELSEGVIEPLRFIFDAPEPVYPLRISSLNPGETEVLLYVLAAQAYGHGSMELEYAERWQPVQIGALAEYSELAGNMEESGGCCVTKLRRTFSPEDMEDLYLAPADKGELAAWAGFASQGGGWPWWALLAVVLGLGALGAAAYGLWGRRGSGWPARALAAFLVVSLAGAAVVFPLGMRVIPGGEGEDASPHAGWPWERDIHVNHNGWSKLVHPDGRVEVLGLAEWLKPTAHLPQAGLETYDDPATDLVYLCGGELDAAAGWRWSARQYRDETGQTRYLVAGNGGSGEAHMAEIGMVEVHDVRLSRGSDRLWVALNPGVPENKTEVREYAFPSLELVRSLLHEDCLLLGEIVMSPEGEPLLAGRFKSGEEYTDTIFGFLPMLENDAGFTGRTIEIEDYGRGLDEDSLPIILLNGYFCDAVDGSPFLLLAGFDPITGESRAFVLGTGDGELYEICMGFPSGWQ